MGIVTRFRVTYEKIRHSVFFKLYRLATSVLVPSKTLLSIIRRIIICLTFKNYIIYLFIAEG